MKLLFFHRLLLDWRITDYTDGLDPTARDFERLIIRLKKRHRFVSSAEIADAFDRGRVLDHDCVFLSFDDGFSSTLTAAEICARHRVPLTVFVVSRVLDGFVPWFVTMRHAIASARRPVTFQGKHFDPADPREAMALNNVIKETVYSSSQGPQQALHEVLVSLNLRDLPPISEKHRFLTRDELLQLHDLGAEIGSHGASHRALPGLAPKDLNEEIRGSCRVLEGIIGTAIRTFSYPDGRFDSMTVAAVRESGIDLGFAAGSRGSPTDRHILPRVWLGRHVEHIGRARFQETFRLWDRARVRVSRVRRGQ